MNNVLPLSLKPGPIRDDLTPPGTVFSAEKEFDKVDVEADDDPDLEKNIVIGF